MQTCSTLGAWRTTRTIFQSDRQDNVRWAMEVQLQSWRSWQAKGHPGYPGKRSRSKESLHSRGNII